MKKILIVPTIGLTYREGITNVILNYCRNMDKKNITMDFIVIKDLEEELKEELLSFGGKLIYMPKRKKEILTYLFKFSVLMKNKYDVVHVHGNSSTMGFELFLAKLFGVKTRIAHSHNSRSDYEKLHRLLLPIFKGSYTHAIAVSELAGDWIFGQGKYLVFKNAIDLKRFSYKSDIRDQYRRNLNIEDDTLVIGHVGRFVYQKNHSFIIDVFEQVLKNNPKAILILIGTGKLKIEMEQKVKALGIANSVHFLGQQMDVYNWLQAMDIFLFPSNYEGLGMVAIESQATGLLTVASTEIPEEAELTPLLKRINLNEAIDQWVHAISIIDGSTRQIQNEAILKKIREAGYDIQFEAKKLLDLYEK